LVGLLVGKEVRDDKEYNNLLLDDVEFETKYDGCKHYTEHPKKRSLTDSHLQSATTRTSQQKGKLLKDVSLHCG
jgi:hypothetical protein